MKLRDWRKKHDLTMVQAAPRLGISQSSISRIETGEQWPDRETMQKIIEGTAGEVTADDFMPDEPRPDASELRGVLP